MSKFFTSLAGLLLACLGLALASEDMPVPPSASGPETASAVTLPVQLSPSRYAALAKKSPFTLASATQENADFAKDLVLAGYARLEGKEFVMVAKRNGPQRLMVGTQPSPSSQGMVLEKVQRDPEGNPTKMTAVIRKGSETATLRYESSNPMGQGMPAAPMPMAQPAAVVPAAQAAPINPAVRPGRVMPVPPPQSSR